MGIDHIPLIADTTNLWAITSEGFKRNLEVLALLCPESIAAYGLSGVTPSKEPIIHAANRLLDAFVYK